MESPRAVAKSLLAVLEKYGQGDYIGESISQLEHSLQAAHQAKQAGKFSIITSQGCYHFTDITHRSQSGTGYCSAASRYRPGHPA